jgi:hypothetical protein
MPRSFKLRVLLLYLLPAIILLLIHFLIPVFRVPAERYFDRIMESFGDDIRLLLFGFYYLCYLLITGVLGFLYFFRKKQKEKYQLFLFIIGMAILAFILLTVFSA